MSSIPAARTERRRRSLLFPFAESVALAALIAYVNFFLRPEDPGLASMAPHPTLFAGLLIAARYGLGAALIGTVVLALEHGVALVVLADVPTPYHYLDAPYSTPLALLVPTLVVVGTVVDRHIARLYGAMAGSAAQERELARLRAESTNLRDVNVGLAEKVVGAEVTFSTLYRASKGLNGLRPDEIYAGLAAALTEVARVEVVSIWAVHGPGTLHLAFRSGDVAEPIEPPPIGAQIEAYFDDRGVLAIHDLPPTFRDPQLPYILGRVTEGRGGKVVAYVAVERLPFARYSAETLRLFSLAIEWASDSLARARAAWARSLPEADTMRDNGELRAALEGLQDDTVGARRGELVRLFASVDAALGGGPRGRRPSASGAVIEPPVEAASASAPSRPGEGEGAPEGGFASSPLGHLLVGINDYLSGDRKRRR